MELKLCKKCNERKSLGEFRLKKDKCGKYYKYSYCKECEKKYLNLKRKEYDKKYREERKEQIALKRKIKNNEISFEKKEKRKEYYKTYVKNNKEKLKKARNLYEREKSKIDKKYKLKNQVRHCIRNSFIKKGFLKSNNTENILGISLDIFYKYLLQTYKNNYGDEWDGVEKVHIDHKTPLATAKTEEDVIKLCHYTNLQLLKEKDNLEKKDNLDWELL